MGAVLNVQGKGHFLRVEVRVGAQLNFIIGLDATRPRISVTRPPQRCTDEIFFSVSPDERECQDAVRWSAPACLNTA